MKRSFLTGLFLLLPLGVSILVLQFLLDKLGKPASVLFFGQWITTLDKQWVEVILSILSIGIVIGIITLFGWLSKYFLGKWFLNLTEKLIANIPFINTVYNTVTQIVDTLSQDKKAMFDKAVLVEFPRKGIYSIGFLTNCSRGEIQEKTKEEVYNVFVPTTPNPTSGFLIMVPKENIILLEMTASEAMKVIISGGALIPPYPKSTQEKDLEIEDK